jgi:Right handed beta helix region/Chlamydia polymorphic membrane protein (Chlamydia_PMP) repeat
MTKPIRAALASVLLATVGSALQPTPASAQTIYVDQNATGPAQDGSTWCTAYVYLQDALSAAAASGGTVNEIRVADGTYKPDQGASQTPGDREATFQLLNGVTIAGGYAGCGATAPNDRDLAAYETILRGDLAGNDTDVPVADLLDEPTRAENSYHVVTGSGTNESASIDGCTITAGNANENSVIHGAGAGMYNVTGSPSVADCTFLRNSAYGVYFAGGGGGMLNSTASHSTVTNCSFIQNSAGIGAGMHNRGSSPTVVGCTFRGNSGISGAGMYNNEGGSPTVSDCTFTENSASNVGGGMRNADNSPTVSNCAFTRNSADEGGGMRNGRSSPLITNCTFAENSATSNGGGIDNYNNGNSTVINSTFTGNTSGRRGGGIRSSSSTVTVTNSTFNDNVADTGGGGISNYSGSVKVTNCSFSGNAAGEGGGMYNNTSSPAVNNCVFRGNSAWYGGGMSNQYDSSPFVTNCTFSGNLAAAGGGVYNTNGSNPTLTNCILWRNTPYEVVSNLSTPTVSYSNMRGGFPGEGNVDSDPMFLDVDGGDLQLRSESPCVDAGNNDAVPVGVDADANGDPRFADHACADDLGNGIPPVVDMGAFEFQSWATCGNGVCDPEESCESCACDCGSCCGDAVCAAYEDCVSCATDCACQSLHVPGDYDTIQECIDAAQTGDECIVGPGTYYEAISFLGKAISLRSSHGRDVTTIDATGLKSSVVRCVLGEGPDTLLDGFTITGGNASQGGGMLNDFAGSPTVRNCAFVRNSAQDGGGMYNNAGSGPNVASCDFRENAATSSGGGIASTGGAPISPNATITDCAFIRNTAGSGGAISTYGGLTVTSCEFYGNSANWRGGAIYSRSTTLDLTYCTIIGNVSKGNGGGIFADISNPIAGCTFARNTALNSGGAIYRSYYSRPTLSNCILWKDAPDEIGYQSLAFDITISFSNVQGGLGFGTIDAGGNIDQNPLFIRPPNPGTDETWGTEDDDYGDLRLRSNSPSIDTGDPGFLPEPDATDIAGTARLLCDRIDMGAFEFAGDYDCNQTLDLRDVAGLQICFTGEDQGPYAPTCKTFDTNADQDIDQEDYARFQSVFSP